MAEITTDYRTWPELGPDASLPFYEGAHAWHDEEPETSCPHDDPDKRELWLTGFRIAAVHQAEADAFDAAQAAVSEENANG